MAIVRLGRKKLARQGTADCSQTLSDSDEPGHPSELTARHLVGEYGVEAGEKDVERELGHRPGKDKHRNRVGD